MPMSTYQCRNTDCSQFTKNKSCVIKIDSRYAPPGRTNLNGSNCVLFHPDARRAKFELLYEEDDLND